MKKVLAVLVCCFLTTGAFAQKKTQFKLMASFSGLGAALQYNPVSIVFVQANLTSTFSLTRIGLQSKLTLWELEDFALKGGVEGAYFIGDLKVGGFKRSYDQVEFMPLITAEWKVIGIEVPVILERDFSGFFPMVAITLNVTNDEKTERKRRRRRKDFERQTAP